MVLPAENGNGACDSLDLVFLAIHTPAEIKACLDVPDNSNYIDKQIRQINQKWKISWTRGKNTYGCLEAPKVPCGAMTAKSASGFL